MSFELKGRVYETDGQGYLQNPEDWNKEVAQYLAKVVGLELTSEHWEVIGIIREHYQKYQTAPPLKVITNQMKRLCTGKDNKEYFFNLFPDGPYNQAYKIAGVPMPYTDCGCERALMRWYLWSKTYEGIPSNKPHDTPSEPPWLQSHMENSQREFWQ